MDFIGVKVSKCTGMIGIITGKVLNHNFGMRIGQTDINFCYKQSKKLIKTGNRLSVTQNIGETPNIIDHFAHNLYCHIHMSSVEVS